MDKTDKLPFCNPCQAYHDSSTPCFDVATRPQHASQLLAQSQAYQDAARVETKLRSITSEHSRTLELMNWKLSASVAAPPQLAELQAAYNQGVEDAKCAIRAESQGGGYWAATYINAIVRRCSPFRYTGLPAHADEVQRELGSAAVGEQSSVDKESY